SSLGKISSVSHTETGAKQQTSPALWRAICQKRGGGQISECGSPATFTTRPAKNSQGVPSRAFAHSQVATIGTTARVIERVDLFLRSRSTVSTAKSHARPSIFVSRGAQLERSCRHSRGARRRSRGDRGARSRHASRIETEH